MGRQTPFSDSDIKWSKEVIEKAFLEGYDIEVVCPNETITHWNRAIQAATDALDKL